MLCPFDKAHGQAKPNIKMNGRQPPVLKDQGQSAFASVEKLMDRCSALSGCEPANKQQSVPANKPITNAAATCHKTRGRRGPRITCRAHFLFERHELSRCSLSNTHEGSQVHFC